MAAYPGGHVGFGIAAVLTHAVLGYTLGALVFDRPAAGVLGGVAPDCDHLLHAVVGPPFVHRGVTHSFLAVGVVVAVATRYDRGIAGALGVGHLSHVLLDATTPMGVMLAYPLSTSNVAVVLHGHSPRVAAVVVGCCLIALGHHRWRPPARPDRL